MPLDPEPPEVVQVRLPRRYLVGVIAFGVLFTGFVLLSSYVFTDQLATIKDQNRKQTGLVRSQLPVLREARDQLPATRDQLKRSRKLLRTAQPVVEDLGPVVDALTPEVLEAALTGTTRTLDEVRRRALLARLSRTLGATHAALLRTDRLDLLEDADRAAELAPELYEVQRRTFRIQQETLAIHKQALQINREVLQTARETLVHARSLDQKTGGTAPGATSGGVGR